mmetsp:Transcript_67937/g.190275  ORF Transcript_67937/g.190275 Transcript_67937/m.190275 type:complete len:505 (+) Transcript_67937:84-1598(+)
MASKGALVTVDRQYLYHSFQDGLKFTFNEAFQKDNHYTLFRSEDKVAWFTFTAVFIALIALDNCILNRNPKALTMGRAIMFTVFWVLCAAAFCGWVYWYYGQNQAFMWMSGYMLEWMLSFDNLFVFHLVFAYYCTPEALLYRALYFGIAGAIVFRVLFLAVGFTFMSSGVYLFKFVCGAVLVWSGVRSANDLNDEDTGDPTNNKFIAWVTRNLPVSDTYEPHGHFFVDVLEVDLGASSDPADGGLDDEAGGVDGRRGSIDSLSETPLVGAAIAPGALPRLESFEGNSLLDSHRAPARSGAGALPSGGAPSSRGLSPHGVEALRQPTRPRKKASLLLLVVVAVWGVDLIFAVDSVASKLASVSDIFLNCASSAFTMMGLRSLYFVMESLAQTFENIKHGISAILIFIGLKLVASVWHEISNGVCFAIILGILAASIASSYWSLRLHEDCQVISMGGTATALEGDEVEEHDRGLNAGLVEDRGPEQMEEPTFDRAPFRLVEEDTLE